MNTDDARPPLPRGDDSQGWISGPGPDYDAMTNRVFGRPRIVPPGSTAHRELLRAIGDALTVPQPVTQHTEKHHELVLRRVQAVRHAIRSALAHPVRETDDDDLMNIVTSLKWLVSEQPADYPHHGASS